MHREISHRSAAAWPEWSTWQEILARCYGQGYQNDAAIGQVLDELDELGLSDEHHCYLVLRPWRRDRQPWRSVGQGLHLYRGSRSRSRWPYAGQMLYRPVSVAMN